MARMAPKAVRAWRGQDFSEEDMRWMSLMHSDSVDAANEGYAMMALQPDPASPGEIDKKRQRQREKRERWWRRLREDAAGASTTLAVSDDSRGGGGVDVDSEGVADGGAETLNSVYTALGASGEDVAREVQTILRAAEKKEAEEAAEAIANGFDPNDDEADAPPQEMTSDVAGDMVVMDTRVWHYGEEAEQALTPRTPPSFIFSFIHLFI